MKKRTCTDNGAVSFLLNSAYNAYIEFFFSHLKTDKLYRIKCKSEEIKQAIEDYIYHNNYKHFLKRLKQRAPVEYRHALVV
ncbi:IS3 family transposase [Niallia taxi]|uniref:IS3 family transposase n=1 Tax=Niallia taxi TaxID=2499688 RepID=UPI00399D24BC